MAWSVLGSGQPNAMAAQTSSFSVTVPSGTDLAVIGFTGYGGTANGFAGGTATLGGASMTIIGADANTAMYFTSLCYIVNPSSGSQTLAWNWVGTQWSSFGGPVLAAYFSGVNTADPVRSSATVQDATMAAATTGTLTCLTGDKLIAVSSEFCNNVNRTCTWTGLTELVAGVPAGGGVPEGKGDISLATADPTANQAAAVSWDFSNDGGIAAVCFKPAAAGVPIAWIRA